MVMWAIRQLRQRDCYEFKARLGYLKDTNKTSLNKTRKRKESAGGVKLGLSGRV